MATPLIYQSGVQTASLPLLGTERVLIDNGGAVTVETSTQAIADLAQNISPQLPVLSTAGIAALTTVGLMALSTTDIFSFVGTQGEIEQIATQSSAQTLTNKTLTSPTITGGTLTGSAAAPTTIVDAIFNGNTMSTASITLTTTSQIVPAMSVVLTTAGTYAIQGHINGTAGVDGTTGGLQLKFGGTATADTSNITSLVYTSAGLAAAPQNQTSWGSNLVALTTAATDVFFQGSVVVSQGGSITMLAAQNVYLTTASTVAMGSTMIVGRVS